MIHPYATEASRERLAREIAENSFVLLKNEQHCLPLPEGKVAFFGRSQLQPNLGGLGSGSSMNGKRAQTILDACRKERIFPVQALAEYYETELAKETPYDMFSEIKSLMASGVDLVASGAVYEIFGRYHAQDAEPAIPQELLIQVKAETDTAVLLFGRKTGGEECDRHLVDDYELLESEKALIETVCNNFPRVIVVLNINGVAQLKWLEEYPAIRAVLYIGTPGEQGPAALARVLRGEVSPSGRLAFTIANDYMDYPTAENFSFSKESMAELQQYKDYGLDAKANGSRGFEASPVTVYQEGVYLGYRYFDTFHKPALYPFGSGMSYAQFEAGEYTVVVKNGELQISARVQNVSATYSGRETILLYLRAPQGRLEQPLRKFIGCLRTKILKPGQSQICSTAIHLGELASYDEERAAWLCEAGDYLVYAGGDVTQSAPVALIRVSEEVTVQQVKNALGLHPENRGKIGFLTAKNVNQSHGEWVGTTEVNLSAKEFECDSLPVNVPRGSSAENGLTLRDVKEGRGTLKQLVEQMTLEELAVLCVGFGTGLPFGGMGVKASPTIQYPDGSDIAHSTHKTGMMGYITPAISKYEIGSACYKDGPSSVGMTAWPNAMTMACSFDTELIYAYGAACAYEADLQQVDSWLAPAINLNRNPLCGRNFEYFSEDPVWTGLCAAAVCSGATQTTGVTPCPKHFALNEQETYRRGCARKQIDAVDSIAEERTIREVYLKPFQMVLKNGNIRTLMTSFNKINGVFAAGNADLCRQILREEWGYQGVVVTDWGDMDIVVDGADAVAAGNDVVMPGGPPVIRQILDGYQEGRVTRKQMEEAAMHLLYYVQNSPSCEAYWKQIPQKEC